MRGRCKQVLWRKEQEGKSKADEGGKMEVRRGREGKSEQKRQEGKRKEKCLGTAGNRSVMQGRCDREGTTTSLEGRGQA